MWFQIIDKAREIKKPIIFITNDLKDDWWLKLPDGKTTISPRPELIEEIYSEAKVSFYMYQTDQFMRFAETYLDVESVDAAIDEVQRVRTSAEELQERIEKARLYRQDPLVKNYLSDVLENTQAGIDWNAIEATKKGRVATLAGIDWNAIEAAKKASLKELAVLAGINWDVVKTTTDPNDDENDD